MAQLNPFETKMNFEAHWGCGGVCEMNLAEGVGLALNSLGGVLSRRARSCAKCAIKASARRFAGSRRTETGLIGNPFGSSRRACVQSNRLLSRYDLLADRVLQPRQSSALMPLRSAFFAANRRYSCHFWTRRRLWKELASMRGEQFFAEYSAQTTEATLKIVMEKPLGFRTQAGVT